MKLTFTLFFVMIVISANAQIPLTIEGKSYNNFDDTWLGVNITRNVPTKLIFKNNSLKSINRYGYLLQAGDEGPASTNNNLDGAVISGNKFSWSGSDMTVIPHGVFTGHNNNVIIRYNYLNYVPMGIIRKSGNNMSNTGGGVAYNIVKGGTVGMVVKGMSNVNIYNNTFYNDRTTSQTWRPLLHIYTNTDGGKYSVAHGTKIYNNIFYTKYQTLSITVHDNESLTGLKCDYNVYWCESGSPKFSVNGVVKSFAQWQAMGFDTHSVVVNPEFKDFVNFVPSKRLDFGTDLGQEWKDGLAVNAVWGTTDPALTAQNGTWQAGAVIIAGTVNPTPTPTIPPVSVNAEIPVCIKTVVENAAPAKIEMLYNSSLANVTPPDSAFIPVVNGVRKTVADVVVTGNKVIITLPEALKSGDVVTVSYLKSAVNPLQSTSGATVETISGRAVVNNINIPVGFVEGSDMEEEISFYPNPAKKYLNIRILNPKPLLTRIIRIFDFAGKLCFEKELETDVSQIMAINLKSGFYVLHLDVNSETKIIHKLIVVE